MLLCFKLDFVRVVVIAFRLGVVRDGGGGGASGDTASMRRVSRATVEPRSAHGATGVTDRVQHYGSEGRRARSSFGHACGALLSFVVLVAIVSGLKGGGTAGSGLQRGHAHVGDVAASGSSGVSVKAEPTALRGQASDLAAIGVVDLPAAPPSVDALRPAPVSAADGVPPAPTGAARVQPAPATIQKASAKASAVAPPARVRPRSIDAVEPTSVYAAQVQKQREDEERRKEGKSATDIIEGAGATFERVLAPILASVSLDVVEVPEAAAQGQQFYIIGCAECDLGQVWTFLSRAPAIRPCTNGVAVPRSAPALQCPHGSDAGAGAAVDSAAGVATMSVAPLMLDPDGVRQMARDVGEAFFSTRFVAIARHPVETIKLYFWNSVISQNPMRVGEFEEAVMKSVEFVLACRTNHLWDVEGWFKACWDKATPQERTVLVGMHDEILRDTVCALYGLWDKDRPDGSVKQRLCFRWTETSFITGLFTREKQTVLHVETLERLRQQPEATVNRILTHVGAPAVPRHTTLDLSRTSAATETKLLSRFSLSPTAEDTLRRSLLRNVVSLARLLGRPSLTMREWPDLSQLNGAP